MNIDELPNELLLSIFKYLLPNNSCNINEFKHYFLVNKKWHSLFNSNYLKNLLYLEANYSHYIKNNKRHYGMNVLDINKPIINYEVFTYNYIIMKLCYKNIILKTIPSITNYLFTIKYLINLPICNFKKSKCIYNKCHLNDSGECYNNSHNIFEYITHGIMRGIDDLGSIYLLFTYIDLDTNEYFYEFIYHTNIYNTQFLTYSGIYNKTYIGMLSDNNYFSEYIYDREIYIESYNYMHKLLNKEKCGRPKYNDILDIYQESNEGNIVLI